MIVKQKNPSPDMLIQGLRSMGYSFQTAVADIIDNSIAANATSVNIFYDSNEENPFFEICDNGKGMNATEFDLAMDFGTKKERTFTNKKELGRFGLGLKTASLSQCKRLTVVTKYNGIILGAYWDIDDIIETNSWQLTYLDDNSILKIPNIDYLNDKLSGTIVLWQKFDKLKTTTKDFSTTMERIVQNDVLNHCAIVFHRFYKTMPIYINNKQLPKRDPFLDDFDNKVCRPELIVPTEYGVPIIVKAYRMPAENDLNKEEIELIGGKTSLLTDDGLYIYRNDRLISWGNWMKLEHRNLYTHLARIKIDIPSCIDKEFGLDVKKSMAIIPDSIKEKIRPAICDGIGQSKQRTRYAGKKESDLGIVRVWNRTILENNKVVYELNDEYPLLQQLEETLSQEQKKLLTYYLKDLVEFVPVSKMRDDVADSLYAINGKQEDSKKETLKKELFDLVDQLPFDSMQDAINILISFLSTERFSDLKEEHDEIIKEYRRHYESR